MEEIYSSEKSVDFQRTTRRYIPEDRTLQLKKLSGEVLTFVILFALNVYMLRKVLRIEISTGAVKKGN
jgi:hypothetical protein